MSSLCSNVKVEINSLSPPNPGIPGERQCLDGLQMLSFPAVPQTGSTVIPAIPVLFLPPTSSVRGGERAHGSEVTLLT